MAVRVKIDFNKVYEFDDISPDFNLSSFNSRLDDGKEIPLKVKISNQAHDLLPNVYNLAFGPLNKQGKIDDRAELAHNDYSKVFSTILFSAYAYLRRNPGHVLGVDGSDNTRAYFYYRALKRNFSYLTQHFDMFGVKYFVRITRFGKTQYDNPFDFQEIMPYPYKIGPDDDISQNNMYNYFLFTLKQEH
ncbi:MAG: hypothetical protein P4L51_10410 [Puia sp.]|nr:hypothetical protein [Puia sp.]